MKSKYILENYRMVNEDPSTKYMKDYAMFSLFTPVYDHGLIIIRKLSTDADGLVDCVELCLRYRNRLLF